MTVQVTVLYPNKNATNDCNLQIQQATSRSQRKSIKRRGYKTEQISSCSDLRELTVHVANKLGCRPKHVWIYEKAQDDSFVPAQADLTAGSICYAFEVYDEYVPCDLYRTVDSGQITPAMYCLPQKRGFTRITPLLTAALTRGESGQPWCGLGMEDQPFVRGLSLFSEHAVTPFCGDNTLSLSDSKRDPYQHVQDPGSYYVPLVSYNEMVNEREQTRERNHDVGILKNSVSHFEYGPRLFGFRRIIPTKVGSNGKKIKQAVFLLFKLEAGTDLRPHGLVVVKDNLGEMDNHYSLVPVNGIWQIFDQEDEIERSILPTSSLPSLPPANGANQTEVIFRQIVSDDYFVMRTIVPRFEFCGLEIRAKAEPVPLGAFDDDNAETMYQCASFLFSCLRFNDEQSYAGHPYARTGRLRGREYSSLLSKDFA